MTCLSDIWSEEFVEIKKGGGSLKKSCLLTLSSTISEALTGLTSSPILIVRVRTRVVVAMVAVVTQPNRLPTRACQSSV